MNCKRCSSLSHNLFDSGLCEICETQTEWEDNHPTAPYRMPIEAKIEVIDFSESSMVQLLRSTIQHNKKNTQKA